MVTSEWFKAWLPEKSAGLRLDWPGETALYEKENIGGHVAPHGGRAAPPAAGARLIAAPTPRRRHLARRGAALRRRQNGGELAARPLRQNINIRLLLFSSRLVLSRARTCARRAKVAAFAPRRPRFEPGATRRGDSARRQKVRRSLHGGAAVWAAPYVLLSGVGLGSTLRRRLRTTSRTCSHQWKLSDLVPTCSTQADRGLEALF